MRINFNDDTRALVAHIAPFAVWLGVMFAVLSMPPSALPWSYAGKSIVCAALFLILRPWRGAGYLPWRGEGLRSGVWVGFAVFVVWVAPELPVVKTMLPGLQAFYYDWFVFPIGTAPDYVTSNAFPARAFAPEQAGWALTVAKLCGSAFVIAIIEEFFFRGFFMRWMSDRAFRTVPVGMYDAYAFWMTVLVFGLEHDRWLAGMIAGVAYGALVIRTKQIWPAVIAHVTTNLYLAIYVIYTNSYGFW